MDEAAKPVVTQADRNDAEHLEQILTSVEARHAALSATNSSPDEKVVAEGLVEQIARALNDGGDDEYVFPWELLLDESKDAYRKQARAILPLIAKARNDALDECADKLSEIIASEFKGFWAAEDMVEEIPAAIRALRSSQGGA